jgi:hypothetical protein
MTRLQELQYKEYKSWLTTQNSIEIYLEKPSLFNKMLEVIQMNENTVRQQLNLYLQKGKINFYQLKNIIREVEQSKLMKDLTKQERDLIDSYINN